MFQTFSRLALLVCAPGILLAETIDVRLIAFNDFHGNLRTPVMGVSAPDASGKIVRTRAGGVEYMASWVHALQKDHPNTAVVAAGDLIGASPLISSLFHDEASIEALNTLGLEFSSVGNHEFDAGQAELQRMQQGGCHPGDNCHDRPFAGAQFTYLAANVIDKLSGKPFFPSYAIKKFDGVPVAFVGMTLKGTPAIISPQSSAGLEFRDEADTVNALVPELSAQGVHTIVVLVHQGGRQQHDEGINGCGQFSGPMADMAQRLDPSVAVIVSGHTHEYYNCRLSGKLVTSAYSFSRMLTSIDLKIDRDTDRTVDVQAENHIVTTDVEADPAETALIAKYESIVKPMEERVIGHVKATLDNRSDRNGESPLGHIIAQAYLEAVKGKTFGYPVIGMVNHGSVRTAIEPGKDGVVTYGQAFSTQPFRNNIVAMTLSGSDLIELLEQQFDGAAGVLQLSDSLHYRYRKDAPKGEHVDKDSIKVRGKPIDPAADYRIAINNFMAQGGDGYTVFKRGRDQQTGPLDIDALVSYLGRHTVDPARLHASALLAE